MCMLNQAMTLVKNILALLADWANGIFAVLLASHITGTEIIWWHFLLGIVFSHLLDLDAVPDFLQRGMIGGAIAEKDHRDGLHYPLLVIPLAVASILYIGYWGWVVLFALVLHFMNDLYGTGWGIQIFWPFSRRRFKVLGRRVNQPKYILIENGLWDELPHSERRLRFFVTWSVDEISHYFCTYGMDNWVDTYYARGSVVAYIEYVLFTTAVVLALHTMLV